jgi:hypothetical protein
MIFIATQRSSRRARALWTTAMPTADFLGYPVAGYLSL